MSRSGYDGEFDFLALGRWRGQVASAIRGRRGQALLRDLLAALDAMPEKGLIARELEADGEYCALGLVGKARGVVMTELDPEDCVAVASAFNIAQALACETAYVNDECGLRDEMPQHRWERVRAWAIEQINEPRA